MDPLDFSLVIPTYNGADRLPSLFQCLRRCWHHSHSHRPSLRGEIILVDNNSQDATPAITHQEALTWDQRCPLHYVLEPRQGAAYARHRGIHQAQGTIVGFVDDDNWPEPGWILAALDFADAHPQAGAFGSQIHGAFQVPPDPALKPLFPFLALVERGDRPLLYVPHKKILPPSAGLVVRRQVWLDCTPDRPYLTGRTASTMITGEDLEALAHIQRRGWELWYNPAMVMHHQIPLWRLDRAYLIPFFRGIGLSRHITRMAVLPPLQRPLWVLIYGVTDWLKILIYGCGFHILGQKTLVLECYLTLAWYSARSFWHFLGIKAEASPGGRGSNIG
jgi:glycosyltransferase involved in cell wall biosynthesis